MKRGSRELIVGIVVAVCLASSCSKNPVETKDPIACEHVDAEGVVIESGVIELANQWLGAVQGGIQFSTSAPLVVTVTFLDADSARVAVSEDCPDHALRWVTGDTAILRVEAVAGQRWQARLTGLQAGTTTLRFRVWHGDHADFTSLEIPVGVSDSSSSPAYFVDGCAIMRNDNMLVSHNYDRGTGLGQSYGALIVSRGGDLTDLEIELLDTLADSNGIRFPVVLSEPDSIVVTIADTAIAEVTMAETGGSSFDLHGLKAGNTTMSIRLYHGGVSRYSSGNLRIIVVDSLPTVAASFSITQGGVWRIISRGGTLVGIDSLCSNRTPTGYLSAATGELTDLFSFRKLDSCTRSDYASSQRYLVFDIADAGIARIIRHPIHWGEHFVFHVEGLSPGVTSVRCCLVRSDHTIEYVTPSIPIQITG